MRAFLLALLLLAAGAGPVAADDPHAGHGAADDPHGGHGAVQAPHAGHGSPDPGAHEGGFEPGAPSPHSLFQLESAWTTAEGREMRLAELGGRIVVLAMVYTHCEHACPRIIADMRAVRAAVGDVGGRVGYVLVSIDPERDDVARLRAFAEKTRLAGDWTLLRGDPPAVRELAAVLGIRYRRVSETDFIHSNLLSILDPSGVVVHRQIGLGVDPDESVARIRGLLAAEGAAGEHGAAGGHGAPRPE